MIEERNEYRDILERHKENFDGYTHNEVVENLPEGHLSDFKKRLESHPDYENIKKDYIIDEERNILIHILERVPNSEVEDLDKEETFFYPICSKSEIKRMFQMKSAEDYLLRLRAEQFDSNMRLKRVFLALRKKNPSNWSFTHFNDTKLFGSYLSFLPTNERTICKKVPHGTIHSTEANGFCIRTPFGNIITLSYALRNFLYFMNVFHFGSQVGIKPEDLFHSFLIGIRTMLGKESLDFEIDSRGEIPPKAHSEIEIATDWQMYFIIGHEYAHHYLKHLDSSNIMSVNSLGESIPRQTEFYTYRQEQELEADYNAIMKPDFDEAQRTEIADGAFLFFTWLDLYETIEDYLFPKTIQKLTHPNPTDRIWRLREKLDSNIGLSSKDLEHLLAEKNSFKEYFVKEILPFRVEDIETYGSMYLPNYKKDEKIDRLDF